MSQSFKILLKWACRGQVGLLTEVRIHWNSQLFLSSFLSDNPWSYQRLLQRLSNTTKALPAQDAGIPVWSNLPPLLLKWQKLPPSDCFHLTLGFGTCNTPPSLWEIWHSKADCAQWVESGNSLYRPTDKSISASLRSSLSQLGRLCEKQAQRTDTSEPQDGASLIALELAL